jgi:hypothetical protein
MRPHDTPLESNFHHLNGNSLSVTTAADPPPPVTFPYRSALGVLMWFAGRGFPFLRAAVTLLASYAASPNAYHVKCIKRVLKFLYGAADTTLHLAPDPDFDPSAIKVYGFTDADWAADRLSRRSMSGYVCYLNHNPLSFDCKYHPTQCLSTMEAEYMGENHLAKELCFFTHLADELNPRLALLKPLPIFGDNQAALKYAEDPSVNSRNKHIDLRHHYIHTLVRDKIITMNFVCTTNNIADLFTKPLPAAAFLKFVAYVSGKCQSAVKALYNSLTRDNELRHRPL